MNVLKHVDSNINNLISDLQTLIRQPSVSAKNEGIEECSILVSKILMFFRKALAVYFWVSEATPDIRWIKFKTTLSFFNISEAGPSIVANLKFSLTYMKKLKS